MSIVGGLDVHRAQITYDYLDVETGEVEVGRIVPGSNFGIGCLVSTGLPSTNSSLGSSPTSPAATVIITGIYDHL